MQCGGIILCGGHSSRMGLPKLSLPFGPELMLQRVVRLVGEAVRPIVVVAAPGQEIPPLPADVLVVRDRHEGRGPLEGLLAGLNGLPDGVASAYATSCDVPLLVPAFVRRMAGQLGEYDAAVPTTGGRLHPLSAVYRRDVVPAIERLLATDRLRMSDLFAEVSTHVVPDSELVDIDRELTTLDNLNRPSDYLAALARAGFAAPADVLAAFARQEELL